MPYRTTPLVNGEYYHIYNRGLGKQIIFDIKRDYSHFIKTFLYYSIENPKPRFSMYRRTTIFQIDSSKKIVEIIAYCLMPNHFHLLVRQIRDGGITEFMRKFTHSYTKYRNVKYARKGPIFQGPFKVVLVESDEQLLHLSRYIHLNPLVSYLVKDLELYPWSSYLEYIGKSQNGEVEKTEIMNFFKSSDTYKRSLKASLENEFSSSAYKKFVFDQAGYGETIARLKHALIDEH